MLSPLPRPLVVTESRFIVKEETVLKVSEELRSFSGNDFTIIDYGSPTSELWFLVSGKVCSPRQKRILTDRDGVAICNLQKDVFSITKSQELNQGSDGPKICELHVKLHLKAKVSTSVVNLYNGEKVDIFVKGNWLDKEIIISVGEMKAGGVPIAKITRRLDIKSMFSKDTYFVTIAPGVDAAFIVALCIALDKARRK
jgi:uncharacterized protein YxjI